MSFRGLKIFIIYIKGLHGKSARLFHTQKEADGDALDSRVVVGLVERTLLLAPGAVIMSVNGASGSPKCYGEDPFTVSKKNRSSVGCKGEQIITGSIITLLTP